MINHLVRISPHVSNFFFFVLAITCLLHHVACLYSYVFLASPTSLPTHLHTKVLGKDNQFSLDFLPFTWFIVYLPIQFGLFACLSPCKSFLEIELLFPKHPPSLFVYHPPSFVVSNLCMPICKMFLRELIFYRDYIHSLTRYMDKSMLLSGSRFFPFLSFLVWFEESHDMFSWALQ